MTIHMVQRSAENILLNNVLIVHAKLAMIKENRLLSLVILFCYVIKDVVNFIEIIRGLSIFKQVFEKRLDLLKLHL